MHRCALTSAVESILHSEPRCAYSYQDMACGAAAPCVLYLESAALMMPPLSALCHSPPSIDAPFLAMATEDKKAETDTKPPVAPSASQSKVSVSLTASTFAEKLGHPTS